MNFCIPGAASLVAASMLGCECPSGASSCSPPISRDVHQPAPHADDHVVGVNQAIAARHRTVGQTYIDHVGVMIDCAACLESGSKMENIDGNVVGGG